MNNNLGHILLEEGFYPLEKEKNIRTLFSQVKKGNIAIKLSSFEEIYQMSPKEEPYPVGAVSFEDGKKRFVISWVDNFSELKINNVEEYSIRIRNYPVNEYPVLSLMIGIHNGKIDSETKNNLWYYGQNLMDLSLMLTRIKLYQLLNCDEILFCLFDNSVENLDSFGFSLDKKELEIIAQEIESGVNIFSKLNHPNYIQEFNQSKKVVSNCFKAQGLPKTREALDIYLSRKVINPKPSKHNWNDFLSI